jgi:hypothetical protein
LNGTLKGQAQLAGLQGGTLSITQQSGNYALSSSDFENYLGFDAYTFAGYAGLDFLGDMNISAGRSLTFDASSFTGSGNINFQAPYIQLWNQFSPGQTPPSSPGTAQLTLSGQWIDVGGALSLTGFKSVKLSAANDITFSDAQYGQTLQGYMLTSGDLTMQADRIYPTTSTGTPTSPFIIQSVGNITIQGSGASHNLTPIYSAGGCLEIRAANIDMEGGMLAAPMGQISLAATGSVTITGGSVITTAGSIPVNYGSLNDELFWTITNPANTSNTGLIGIPVSGAPQKSVIISGSDVTIESGSKINVSGGGSIFAYEFQADIEGSVDPLQNPLTSQATYQIVYNGEQYQQNVSSLIYDSKIDSFRLATSSDTFVGRWVIVPGGNYSVPASTAASAGLQVGQAVYLDAAPGLKAGVYTLLPEQYAFLPGAMVITDTGIPVTPGTQELSGGGYPVVAGYLTYAGTSVKPSLMDAFEVQPAASVLQQANFNKVSFVAGAGGNLSITANTTVVDGTIAANAMSGYQGGTISLSGTNAFIEESSSQVPSDPASGTLYVAADALTGFYAIDIGNINSSDGAVTQSIEMAPNSVLQATQVVLSAQNKITLDSGAQIITVDSSGNGNGSTSLITPTGLLTMEQNFLVHASDQVTMTIGRLNYQAGTQGVQIDHGTLDITGQNVYFEPQGYSQPQTGPPGLYLTNAFWSNFTNFNNVNISASGGASDGSTQGTVGFLGGMSLSAKDSFSINAAEIEGVLGTSGSAVSINAPTISLLDRGAAAPPSPQLFNVGSLTLNATDQIFIGEGAFFNGLNPSNPNLQNGLLIDGFATLKFNAANDITFLGTGTLATGAGNLNFTSARLTTSYYADANTSYTAADFTVTATNSDVSIASNGLTPSKTVAPGGTLEIDANSIDVSGVIQMASGTLTIHATGTNGVTLSGTAQVLDGGSIEAITVNGQTTYSCSPGGSVYLNADSGPVNIEAGALVNVSGVQEDNYAYAKNNNIAYNVFPDPNDIGVNAGLISIYSPNASAALEGILNGAAGYWKSYNGASVTHGTGGSFALDADDIINTQGGNTDFSALLATLTQSPGPAEGPPTGFTESIDIRVRGQYSSGDLIIKPTDAIYANNVNLTADNGSIDFSGKLDSTALGGGGTIEFNAGKTLTLSPGSTIISPGATVFLNAADPASGQTGYLNFSGAIDVTGLSGQPGGIVHFRAGFLPDGLNAAVNMNLAGSITGASQILAEGVLYGTDSGSGVSAPPAYLTSNTISSSQIGNWQSAIEGLMASTNLGAEIKDSQGNPLFKGLKLTSNNNVAPQFVPGLEIDSQSSLTLNSPWDFANLGLDATPGFLTIRAAHNLTTDQSLVDHPTPSSDSWGMTLVSGADFKSADPTAIVKQTGVFQSNVNDLIIATGIEVYSTSAPIRLAAGGDIVIRSVATQGIYNTIVPYSVATYSGSISVNTGHDLIINGGAIQSATGNIDIHTGGDLQLTTDGNSNLGSIRTTGEPNGNGYDFWTYWKGGNIAIYSQGNVNGGELNINVDDDGWDSYNLSKNTPQGWSASYTSGSGSRVTQGLATMAGGNLTVYAGGSFNCQTGSFSPVAYNKLPDGAVTSSPANDPGNLTIFSGGDMQGRFLIADGIGELRSMGNFGNAGKHPTIEMFNADVNVSAQGNIDVGAIFNPTIARPLIHNNPGAVYWDLEYASATASGAKTYASIILTSAAGDVTLYGDDVYYGVNYPPSNNSNLQILPPTVAITAAGNINILNNFALAPYAFGELSMVAGGDINGLTQLAISGNGNRAEIFMPEMPEDGVYGPQSPTSVSGSFFSLAEIVDPDGILHANDTVPVVVSAGGNISNLQFLLPKAAQITAGGDINNIYYDGHNNNSDDVTIIKAAGNILFGSTPNFAGSNSDTGIQVGGPGTLVIEAGGSIDLGTTAGIQVVGNIYDPSQLPDTAATLIVAAGYSKDFSDAGNDAQFFTSLQSDGVDYSKDLAAGDTAQAQKIVAGARTNVISPFFAGSATTGSGDIDMTFSQISNTTSGIYIFTNGNLNVGGTAFTTEAEQQRTGILTSEGGAINIFANSSVNVNESRVMTFLGGDVTVWSDTGSINAGRGSKTAVDTSPPALVYNNTTKQLTFTFNESSVGSGIRALTYNPDPEAGLQAPLAGNIYLFAPQGDIDAGEAGIAGRIDILGALHVLNANNIVFSQGEIGVPVASELSGLSALTGTGSVTQTVQAQEAAIVSATTSKLGQKLPASDVLSSSSLDVRVLSVFDVDTDDSTWEKTDN